MADLEQVRQVFESGRKSRALATLYRDLDYLLVRGELASVQVILRSAQDSFTDSTILVGLLIATSPWSAQLSERALLLEFVRKRLEREFGVERAERVLKGLDG